MRRTTGALLGISIFAAACGSDADIRTPEASVAFSEAVFADADPSPLLPGQIRGVEPVYGEELQIEGGFDLAGVTPLTDFIQRQESVSAGGFLSSDERQFRRDFQFADADPDALNSLETTREAPCASLTFDDPVEEVYLVGNGYRFGAELSSDGTVLEVCNQGDVWKRYPGEVIMRVVMQGDQTTE